MKNTFVTRMMFKVISCFTLTKGNGLSSHSMVRKFSLTGGGRVMRAMLGNLSPTDGAKPPYQHVCQVGDPVLRLKAEPVEMELIKTAQFKQFVDHLISVMRKYEAFGLAASQIGSPFQVFVIETTAQNYMKSLHYRTSGQPIEIVPLRVFINPKMKILDYNTSTYPESCASICGFSAHVARANSVRIEALDLNGDSFVWEAEGWPARTAQHEMDHLQGKIFTDKMDPTTLSCTIWDIVNLKAGKVALDFYPVKRSKLRSLFFM